MGFDDVFAFALWIRHVSSGLKPPSTSWRWHWWWVSPRNLGWVWPPGLWTCSFILLNDMGERFSTLLDEDVFPWFSHGFPHVLNGPGRLRLKTVESCHHQDLQEALNRLSRRWLQIAGSNHGEFNESWGYVVEYIYTRMIWLDYIGFKYCAKRVLLAKNGWMMMMMMVVVVVVMMMIPNDKHILQGLNQPISMVRSSS